ncbi:extracellular superoxide dismutase [Cu-Zn] isoform X3 [Lissotriton helveticus]
MSGEPREGQDHASSRHTLGGAWLTQIQVDSLKLLNPTGTWTQDQVDSLKLLNSTGTWTEDQNCRRHVSCSMCFVPAIFGIQRHCC